MSEHLRVADDDGSRTITIDRPEVKNALTKAMRDHLCELLSRAERDSEVRVVVITAVDPMFTAGATSRKSRRRVRLPRMRTTCRPPTTLGARCAP